MGLGTVGWAGPVPPTRHRPPADCPTACAPHHPTACASPITPQPAPITPQPAPTTPQPAPIAPQPAQPPSPHSLQPITPKPAQPWGCCPSHAQGRASRGWGCCGPAQCRPGRGCDCGCDCGRDRGHGAGTHSGAVLGATVPAAAAQQQLADAVPGALARGTQVAALAGEEAGEVGGCPSAHGTTAGPQCPRPAAAGPARAGHRGELGAPGAVAVAGGEGEDAALASSSAVMWGARCRARPMARLQQEGTWQGRGGSSLEQVVPCGRPGREDAAQPVRGAGAGEGRQPGHPCVPMPGPGGHGGPSCPALPRLCRGIGFQHSAGGTWGHSVESTNRDGERGLAEPRWQRPLPPVGPQSPQGPAPAAETLPSPFLSDPELNNPAPPPEPPSPFPTQYVAPSTPQPRAAPRPPCPWATPCVPGPLTPQQGCPGAQEKGRQQLHP